MEYLFFIVYNMIVVPMLYLFFAISQWFVPKIREGAKARNEIWKDIELCAANLKLEEYVVLFHCTSMGEFLQAKPLIEAIGKERKNAVIVVTFYSPSGYQNLASHESIRLITYLPFDRPGLARKFFNTLPVHIWIIVKHDIWPNHIRAARQKNIPIILIDANLPSNSKRLLPGIRLLYKILFNWFLWILPVSEDHLHRFKKLYQFHDRLLAAGDTRYDQVVRKSMEVENREIKELQQFQNSIVFVAGSVWPSDTELLIPGLQGILAEFPELQIVFVPHEPKDTYIRQLERELGKIGLSTVLYSKFKSKDRQNVIIVDGIGLLAHIYKYATICYVGGSCGPGIHNVMEPAIFGKPVIFGPRYLNSYEATILHKNGGGFSVQNSNEFVDRMLYLLRNETDRIDMGLKSKKTILSHVGATERIMNILRPLLQ